MRGFVDNVTRLRFILGFASLAIIAALIVLSIVGAFLGPVDAKVMFNSPAMVAFWMLSLVGLIAAVALTPKIYRRPASLAMHIGTILIVAGAMWGSQAGHRVAERLFGVSKFTAGYMVIGYGEPTSVVYDSTLRQAKGQLPFALRLNDFWIEYYGPWELWIDTAPPGPATDEGWVQTRIDWQPGRAVAIAGTDATIEVKHYYDSARPTYPQDAKALVELDAGGTKTLLPAKAGAETKLVNPAVTVTVRRVYRHLSVQAKDVIIDREGSDANPAVELAVTMPDGKVKRHIILETGNMHVGDDDGIAFKYIAQAPTGVVADASTHLPAIELLVRRPNGPPRPVTIFARRGQNVAGFVLQAASPASNPAEREIHVLLFAPARDVKAYKSDITVSQDGQDRVHRVVEVNDPLHYGGYHFYQDSYDQKAQQYTVLSISSDSGLWAVYSGFVLLCAGVFWSSWAPLAGLVWRRRDGH